MSGCDWQVECVCGARSAWQRAHCLGSDAIAPGACRRVQTRGGARETTTRTNAWRVIDTTRKQTRVCAAAAGVLDGGNCGANGRVGVRCHDVCVDERKEGRGDRHGMSASGRTLQAMRAA
jgi:hypothetical protein